MFNNLLKIISFFAKRKTRENNIAQRKIMSFEKYCTNGCCETSFVFHLKATQPRNLLGNVSLMIIKYYYKYIYLTCFINLFASFGNNILRHEEEKLVIFLIFT